MRHILNAAAAVSALFLTGCLYLEKSEVRVRFDDHHEPLDVTLIYHHLSSDATSPEGVEEDYRGLVEAWKGDVYVVDQAREGFVVRDRDVYVEDGHLCAREVLIPAKEHLFEDGEMVISGGERILVFDDEEQTILESNGRIFTTGKNTIIVWPIDEKEIRWTENDVDWVKEQDLCRKNGAEMVRLFESDREAAGGR